MRNGNRRRVEELTLQGWSATQIGRELGISPSTVYVHRHAIRERLHVTDKPRGGRPRKTKETNYAHHD